MSSGFFALLDDVAAIAKTASASLDDIASTTARASAKSAGLVIDDTAVAPKYVIGFSASRELPIVGRITLGSLKNKLLILLPLALLLGYAAPFLITPLLMLGGVYLCYEGVEKIHEKLTPHAAAAVVKNEGDTIRSAVRTDLVLSAEIMAMALATVADRPFVTQMIVLAITGLFITALVYGVVALIMKADDIGLHLARTARHPALRVLGKGLVAGMPAFLTLLAGIGTAAMLWVGGGILLHGIVGEAANGWLLGGGLAAVLLGIAVGALAVGIKLAVAKRG